MMTPQQQQVLQACTRMLGVIGQQPPADQLEWIALMIGSLTLLKQSIIQKEENDAVSNTNAK